MASAERSTWVVLAVVTAVAIAVFVSRAILYSPLSEPILFHDEAGYLFAAIHLAGSSIEPNMLTAPVYNPGYSLLIAPVMWIAEHPETRYALVLGLNALAGALIVPASFFVARRVFRANPWPAVGASVLIAIYPSQSIVGSLAWADAVIPLATMLIVLGVMWTSTSGSHVSAIVTGSYGAFLYLLHPRLIVHGVLLVGLAVALVLYHRCRRSTAVLLVVSYGFGLVAAQALVISVRDSVWTDPVTATGFLSRLVTLGGIVDVLRNAVGEGWYLLVASIGLALVGFVFLLQTIWDKRRLFHLDGSDRKWDSPSPATLTQLYVLLLSMGSLALSAAFLIGELDRVDKLFYGRYNESFLPLLLIAAVVALSRDRRARRVWLLSIAGIGIAGFALVVRYPTTGIPPGVPLNPFLVAGLEGWRHVLGGWEVPAFSIAVITVGLVAVAVSSRNLAIGLLVIGLAWIGTTSAAWQNWRYGVSDGVARFYTIDDFLVDDGVPDTLAFESGNDYLYGLYAYQWALPNTRFVDMDDRSESSIVSRCWLSTRTSPGPGWTLVYAEETVDAALWSRTPLDGSSACRERSD